MNSEQLDIFESSKGEEMEEEKRPQETKLMPRQWALWRLIEHNSLVEHRKTTQKEICNKLKDYGYVWNESSNTSDHCTMIWSDVMENNLSLEHQKIIITVKYEYWIGSERETKNFLKKLWNDLSGRLHRYWEYVKKVGYDGQGRLYDKNLNPIVKEGNYLDDSAINAKLFIQSFNDYDIEMQKEELK